MPPEFCDTAKEAQRWHEARETPAELPKPWAKLAREVAAVRRPIPDDDEETPPPEFL